MAYPATWDGNRYWFDESRQLAIAYRIANGCAITVSSPVGTPNDARASVGEFIRFCDRNAWTPAFYGIHGEWSTLLIEMGWSTTVVAEETIIDLAGFSMTGKKWQDVRSSINRAERANIRVVWTTWPALSVAMTNQIAEISESWVVQKKLPELGFTLGGIDELDDRDILLGLAVDSNDRVQAVTSWMPTWNRGVVTGYTLDFMRRRSESMNGVMEFVIAQAALRFQDRGLQFLSLSGAPLALATSDDREKPVNRALLLMSRALEPVYGFRSLLAFKQKFQPRLDALYVAYPDALALPAVALAISRCYLPGLGFRESASLVRGLRVAPVLT